METNLKAELKRYVQREVNPDLRVFSIMQRIPYSSIDKPEFATIRELAYLRQIEYLKQRLAKCLSQDIKLTEPIINHDNRAAVIYDCMKDNPGGPCLYVQAKIKRSRAKQIERILKQVIVFVAATLWLMAGAVFLVRELIAAGY
jgi:hypothetical protein